MAKKLFTSPRGIAVWPKLDAPDTKFKDEGEYSVKLRLSREDAEPLMTLCEQKADEGYQEAKETLKEQKGKGAKIKALKLFIPYVVELDDAGETETGFVLFTFKMTASGLNKKENRHWQQKPALFDAKGARITKTLRVGGGSTLKVSFEFKTFYNAATDQAGATLKLKAVQILELVEFGSGNADYFGFDAEDGFDALTLPDAVEDEDNPFTGACSADEDDSDSQAAADTDEPDDF
jgi:hypothetical protein